MKSYMKRPIRLFRNTGKLRLDKMKMRENKLQTVTAGLLLNYAVGKWSMKTEVNEDCETDENLL